MHTNDQKPVELTHLKAFVKEALGTRPTVPYEPIIAFALSVHQHVAEIAAARRADLIVVGDSRGLLHRRLLGGSANRIRVAAPCPVVVVNRECRSSLFTSARRPAPTAALRPQPAQRGDGAGSFLGSSVTGTRAVEGRP
jgi:hypothetical protein